MTEIVVNHLAAEGRLDLDAPVASYIPGFPKGPQGGAPTVRQLLTHQAGVPHRVTTSIEETQPLYPSDIVERVKARGLLFEPGSRTLYSSAGYTCLARVVEIVEQRPFDAILQERIFRPAAMPGTTGETGERLMPGRALPYRLGTEAGRIVVASAPYKDLGFLTGAGDLYATADDLLHFVEGMRSGTFGQQVQQQVMDTAGGPWRTWYGRINGYEASVDFSPAMGLTFVFLSNLQSAANWQIRAGIKTLLAHGRPEPVPFPPPAAPQAEPVEELVGLYGERSDPVPIAVVDGRLFRDGDEVYPIDGGLYYEPASGSRMRFARNPAGAIEALVTLWGDGRETTLPRLRGR